MFCPVRAKKKAAASWTVTVPCRGSSLFCLGSQPMTEPTKIVSQSPVEDHRCSAAGSQPMTEPTKIGHSPLSRIIVVLPGGSFVFSASAVAGGHSPLSRIIVVLPSSDPPMSEGMTVGHSPLSRIIVVLPIRCTPRGTRAPHVTVPCRGSSLFCLVKKI